MRLVACTALILAACQPGSDDSFPIVPGGGAVDTFTPAPDGAPADTSGDAVAGSVNGRVCVVFDLRNLTSCSTGDASGITIAIGTSTTMTAFDGSFTIAVPTGSNLAWTATAPDLVPMVMKLGTEHLLPIVTLARYSEMLLDNGVVLQAGDGSVFARVTRSNMPIVGAVASVSPPSVYGPLYDGANVIVWDTDATGAGGVVWIPDAPQGTATLAVVAPAATPAAMVQVPVADGAITFATVAIP